jgi:methionine synthase II (cobalamin-independent)
VLQAVIEGVDADVIVHCCATKPPITLIREAGARGISFDLTILDETMWDEVGEAWEAQTQLFLGLIPSTDPTLPRTDPTLPRTDPKTARILKSLANPALTLADRLGFPRTILTTHAVPTPSCGMAGATESWLRQALPLTRDLAKAFAEPPETW